MTWAGLLPSVEQSRALPVLDDGQPNSLPIMNDIRRVIGSRFQWLGDWTRNQLSIVALVRVTEFDQE